MQSIGTGVSNLLAALDTDTAKELRIALNNQKFKEAVRATWADNSDIAEYLLAHTNSIFFAKDETPRKGPDKDEDQFYLEVFLDDAAARAEFNGRREILRLGLAQRGIHVVNIRDYHATWSVKEHHLFPESIERVNQLFGKEPEPGLSHDRPVKSNNDNVGADQSDLLEIVKRAFCQAYEDVDTAYAVMEKIEGAALKEITFNKRNIHGICRYDCHFFVDERHRETMQEWMRVYGETIISCAKPLKLSIRKIVVHPSFESIRGHHAFPRVGRPEPLKDLNLQELRSQSAQVADEVRRKIRGN